jgi:electron transfer flavoprotein alpha subunit
MTVLCLIETDATGIAESAERALAFAASLARSAGYDRAGLPGAASEGSAKSAPDLAAVWFGTAAADRAVLAAAGVRRAYAVELAEPSGYAPLGWARALAGLISEDAAPAPPVSAVVAASTDRGNEVLAHLAALTGLPMAANCVTAAWTGPGECGILRQRWAGSLLEEAVLTGSPALLTVAADAIADGHLVGEPVLTSVEVYHPDLADDDLLVRATESADRAGGVSLATARVVVGGGRGVGGPEGFAALEELAALLGAAVGVSRVVTSAGWRPHKQQVGQTGTRIAPELYLACGISGAIQHMAGCQSAKNIVAINTDPAAPIVARADYAVIGDLHQVIPALVAALRSRAGGSASSGG